MEGKQENSLVKLLTLGKCPLAKYLSFKPDSSPCKLPEQACPHSPRSPTALLMYITRRLFIPQRQMQSTIHLFLFKPG